MKSLRWAVVLLAWTTALSAQQASPAQLGFARSRLLRPLVTVLPQPAAPACMTAGATQVEPLTFASPILRLIRLTADSGYVEGSWVPPILPGPVADSGVYYGGSWNLTMFGMDTTVMVDSQGTLIPQLRHGWFTDSVLKYMGTVRSHCTKYSVDTIPPIVLCNDAMCSKPNTCGRWIRDITGTNTMFDTVGYKRSGVEQIWLNLAAYQCGFAKPRVPTMIKP